MPPGSLAVLEVIGGHACIERSLIKAMDLFLPRSLTRHYCLPIGVFGIVTLD